MECHPMIPCPVSGLGLWNPLIGVLQAAGLTGGLESTNRLAHLTETMKDTNRSKESLYVSVETRSALRALDRA